MTIGVYEPRRGATNLWELDLSPIKFRSSSLTKKINALKEVGGFNDDTKTNLKNKLLSSLSSLSLPSYRKSKHYDESFKSVHSLTR